MKGQIWVSAVLYMALGVILISIILAVGLPALDKLKDKYTVSQTKDIFSRLDQNIRAVYNEGQGSQRPLKLDFGKGEAKIDPSLEIIQWKIQTQNLFSEPGIPIKEGNLIVLTENSDLQGEYLVTLTLNYTGTLDLNYNGTRTFSGEKRLSIINTGESVQSVFTNESIPLIEVIEL